MQQEKPFPMKKCAKCDEEIGGKAYYVIQMDCIFDGKTTSACKRTVLCSHCHEQLMHWFAEREQ